MSAPRLWMLMAARHGDNAQLRALAADLGRPAREISLSHNALCRVPNAVLGASLVSLRGERKALTPPWPDIVLGIGRRSVPMARWIAGQSGGRTRLVWLGRPRAPLRHFSLVLATPQYAMPDAPNLLRLSLPWHATMGEPAASGPGSHVLAVLGGPSKSAALGAETVDTLAARAAARARALRLPLLATTAPRTPSPLAERFRERLGAGARLYDWQASGGRDNPYRAWLAAAAEIVMTGDSVSVLADAAWTDRPVTVVEVPPPRWLSLVARGAGAPGRAWRRVGGNRGVITSPPDPGAVRDAFLVRGLAAADGTGAWRLAPCRALLEAERQGALARIAALVSSSPAHI